MGVVVRWCNYSLLDILIIIITLPTPLVLALILAAASLLCYFLNVFRSLRRKNNKCQFFTSRGAHVNCALMAVTDVIHSFDWKSAIEHDSGV